MTAHAGRAAAERMQGDSADDQRQLQEQLRGARDVHADLEEGAVMEGSSAGGPSSSPGGPYLGTEQTHPSPPPPTSHDTPP